MGLQRLVDLTAMWRLLTTVDGERSASEAPLPLPSDPDYG